MIRYVAATAAIIACLAGCAGWKPVEGSYSAKGQHVQLQLPKEWKSLTTGNTVTFTRDGLLLQRIAIVRTKLAEKKQFSYTKRRVTEGMLPQEIAEVVIDDLQTTTDVTNMAIEENVPMRIAGEAGCRITYSFRMADGPAYRGILYGFIHDGDFYQMLYLAPIRHYFEKDRETFLKAVASLKLGTNTTAKNNHDRGLRDRHVDASATTLLTR